VSSYVSGPQFAVGTGTSWLGNVSAGDWFTGPDGRTYKIAAIAGNGALTLQKIYLGPSDTGETYGIAQAHPLLSIYAEDTVVDGVLIPKGVYLAKAFIQKASIEAAHIGAAEIDTLHLRGNAVTIPEFAYVATHAGTISALTTINTLTIDRASGVTTKLDVSLKVKGDSDVAELNVAITRQIGAGAETVVHSVSAGLSPRGQFVSFVLEDPDTSGGDTTYRVTATRTGDLDPGNTGPTVSGISLYATQFKA